MTEGDSGGGTRATATTRFCYASSTVTLPAFSPGGVAAARRGRPSRPPVAAAACHRALRVVSRSPMGARSFPVSMVALVPVCANRHPPSRSKSAVEDTRSHTTLPVVNMQTPRSTDRMSRRVISTGSCYVISYCCAHSDRYGYQIAGRFSPGWQSRKVSGFSVRY